MVAPPKLSSVHLTHFNVLRVEQRYPRYAGVVSHARERTHLEISRSKKPPFTSTCNPHRLLRLRGFLAVVQCA